MKEMIQKKKGTKRIMPWILSLAMAMTTFQLPGFTTQVQAAVEKTGDVYEADDLITGKPYICGSLLVDIDKWFGN